MYKNYYIKKIYNYYIILKIVIIILLAFLCIKKLGGNLGGKVKKNWGGYWLTFQGGFVNAGIYAPNIIKTQNKLNIIFKIHKNKANNMFKIIINTKKLTQHVK